MKPPTKEAIKEFFEILDQALLPLPADHCEMEGEVVVFYDKNNRVVSWMPRQDWEDIVKEQQRFLNKVPGT